MGKRSGISLLFGAIIGSLTALFFAPSKGKDLRKKVKDEIGKGGAGVDSMKDEFKSMWGDMKSTYGEVIENDEVKKAIKKGKKVLENIKEEGKKVIDEVNENMNEVKMQSKPIKKQAKKVQKKIVKKAQVIKKTVASKKPNISAKAKPKAKVNKSTK